MDSGRVDLSGKVALVTGASRGIGRAAASALAEVGAYVILGARDSAACEQAADQLRERGLAAAAVTLNVADRRSVQSAFETVRKCGRLDILINNAGVISPLSPIAECDPEAWDDAIAVNLVGAFNVCHAGLPLMKHGATIVNVSSGAADAPIPAMSAYCAGKAGLTMLTRSLALEYQTAGIRVFGFRPGRIDTDMHGELRAAKANLLADIDRGSLVAVDAPAAAIVLLCSDWGDQFCGTEIDLPEMTRMFSRDFVSWT